MKARSIESFDGIEQIEEELENVNNALADLGKCDSDSDYEDLDWYRVELESAIEEDEKFNKEMEADINSNRY